MGTFHSLSREPSSTQPAPNPSSLPSPSIQGADLEGQKGGTRHQKLNVSCLILYMVDFQKEGTSTEICPLHPHILIYIPLYIMVIVFNLLDLFCLSGEWFQLKRKLLMRNKLYLVIEICHDDIKTVCINYSSKSFPADTLFFGLKKVQQYIVLKYYLYVLCLQNKMYSLKCCNTTVFFLFHFYFHDHISNICRACKLSNLAQQLGEGGGVCTIVISNQAPNTRPDGVHQNICIPYPFFPNKILL